MCLEKNRQGSETRGPSGRRAQKGHSNLAHAMRQRVRGNFAKRGNRDARRGLRIRGGWTADRCRLPRTMTPRVLLLRDSTFLTFVWYLQY